MTSSTWRLHRSIRKLPLNVGSPKGELSGTDVGPIQRQFLTGLDSFFVGPVLTLSNELIRRQVAERAVRAALIIVEPPGFKDVLSLSERDELMHVQTLVAQSADTRLNEGILHRCAESNDVERHTAPIGSFFPRS